MKTAISRSNTPFEQSQVALHLMINQLAVSTMPSAARRRSFIMNDIPSEVYVRANAQKLAAVLGSLLNTVINQSSDSCIRVSAKPYGDVMLVHIKDLHNLNGRTFSVCLGQAQKMAATIGGTVTVNEYRKEMTTIALSFMNLPEAA